MYSTSDKLPESTGDKLPESTGEMVQLSWGELSKCTGEVAPLGCLDSAGEQSYTKTVGDAC